MFKLLRVSKIYRLAFTRAATWVSFGADNATRSFPTRDTFLSTPPILRWGLQLFLTTPYKEIALEQLKIRKFNVEERHEDEEICSVLS